MLLNKYKSALKSYADIFNQAKPKEKYRFIFPVRSAGIRIKHAIEIGLKVKKKNVAKLFE